MSGITNFVIFCIFSSLNQHHVASLMLTLNINIITGQPVLFDWQNNGNMDLIVGVGSQDGNILFFTNTGSSTNPSFTKQTENNNPFKGIAVGTMPSLAMVDLNGDGNVDMVVSSTEGSSPYSNMIYLKNFGNQNNLAFSQPEANNNIPFVGIQFNSNVSPVFVDLDDDGNIDAVVGNDGGPGGRDLLFFKNIGKKGSPIFEQLPDNLNPFFGIYLSKAKPALADLGK